MVLMLQKRWNALNRHCKDVVKRDTPTNYFRYDIYRLATKSELPSAEN